MISCICPTLGRANLLEEAIESFLRQDFEDDKELIILNDADWQELSIEKHEEIRLYNVGERYPDMGTKWNTLVELAKYNVLVPWPNDDIMLPWALSTFQAILWGHEYIHPKGRHVMTSKEYRGFSHHGCQGIIAFTKNAWREAGGYPKEYGGQDTGFLHRLRGLYGPHDPQLSPEQAFFIYRWIGIPFHLSGIKTTEKWDGLYTQIQQRYPETHINLKPHWDLDYVEVIKNAEWTLG